MGEGGVKNACVHASGVASIYSHNHRTPLQQHPWYRLRVPEKASACEKAHHKPHSLQSPLELTFNVELVTTSLCIKSVLNTFTRPQNSLTCIQDPPHHL
jgi:hypothetical protein